MKGHEGHCLPAMLCGVSWGFAEGLLSLIWGRKVSLPLYLVVSSASCLPVLGGMCSQQEHGRHQGHSKLEIRTHIIRGMCLLRCKMGTE